MGKILIKYFLSGLVILTPIFITVVVIYRLIIWADELVGLSIPGIGALVVLVGLTVIGFLANIFFTKPIFDWAEDMIQRIPFIGIIYNSVKDVTDAFVGDKKKYTIPVAVKISDTGLLKLGFITGSPSQILSPQEEGNYEAVYMPHSYNFSGNLFIVPKSNIIKLSHKSTDIMKYIVSGGAIDLSELEVGKSSVNE